ncbi:inositol 1,4,5-trisphosphate receptor-interacting protein-like 1 [Turdus rufiventris]|nr:inositol 1,4,5-trisphosphate receptor-interacting protein-like 1 [Turdus rufiventris]
MPEFHPSPGCHWDTCSECCSIQENSSTQCLLVILQPLPGHSFSLDSTEQPPAGHIHVVLECLCSREQLLGQRCFLHTSGGQLLWDQDWYLLDTLCTGSCLDPKKANCWVGTFLEKENTTNLLGKTKACNCINLGSFVQLSAETVHLNNSFLFTA